jgi:hypothetical protein
MEVFLIKMGGLYTYIYTNIKLIINFQKGDFMVGFKYKLNFIELNEIILKQIKPGFDIISYDTLNI